MNTPTSIVERITDTSLTERGRKITNRTTAVLAGVAVAGAAAGFYEFARNSEAAATHPDAEQLQFNERLITGAREMFGSTIVLKSGVRMRLSQMQQNGDKSGDRSNVVATVPSGEDLVISSAISTGDYIAFERPDTVNPTLEQRAHNLVFVDRSALEAQSPELIEMSNPNFGSVAFDGNNGFEWTDSSQPIDHPLDSTLMNVGILNIDI
jgi:hypothetical protein